MDLKAVRTLVTVAGSGQFQEAAAVLAVTQQAVSKRIAALEQGAGRAAVHPDRPGRRPDPAHQRSCLLKQPLRTFDHVDGE